MSETRSRYGRLRRPRLLNGNLTGAIDFAKFNLPETGDDAHRFALAVVRKIMEQLDPETIYDAQLLVEMEERR
ncbi:MAG: hypothetical protein HYR72_27110 [Deltaproteobacteria bacterium]|nr:hypothetical protein [Deltaproteobacteria bacterium]MBI3390315.1 hypothetical protein [Deltaproteobacteria bacterium]